MKKATLTFVGDMMCSQRMTECSDMNYSFAFERANKLKKCDYLIGNLETPIAGEEMKYTYERYRFNTPNSFLDALKDCGFGLLTLANNHCMDRGEEGIKKTLKICHEKGFDTIGIYDSEEARNRVFVKEINGIRIGFVNYTYGTNAFAHHTFLDHPYMVNLLQPEETRPGSIHLLNRYPVIASDLSRIYGNEAGTEYAYVKPYLDNLREDIARTKDVSDYVIAIIHNGGQYIQDVDPYSAFIAEKVKEFGADIIVGHHQHLIQGSEHHDGYLKIFCLGNFITDTYIEGDGFCYNPPVYNAVFHLELTMADDGNISENKSFSIYTTALDPRGLPVAIDSFDVHATKNEVYLREDVLRCAKLFSGGKEYLKVAERYEI